MRTIASALLLLAISATTVNAQQAPAYAGPTTQAYGKVDIADLQLKACDFEKDANAMVLFDKGNLYYDNDFNVTLERHKRIKIFNDNGKGQANVRLEFFSVSHYEYITGLEAQTINEVNGKPEITKVEKKAIFTESVDKSRSAYVFSFPNVKPGSIIEFRYRWGTNSLDNVPAWSFQDQIPTRYSELDTHFPDLLYIKEHIRVRDQYVKVKPTSESRSLGYGENAYQYSLEGRDRALANVHSMPDEPYMSSLIDNLQSISFQLTAIRPINGFVRTFSDTWAKVGGILAGNEDFGMQLKRKLAGEDELIKKAKALPNDVEKIAFLFKEVQNAMKWNGMDRWYTNDGTVKAWEKKTGNSAEINLILYRLLNKAGVLAFPMVVSTRNHGKVNPAYTFLYQFNRAVVYVPKGLPGNQILDAAGKYNSYAETPDNLLNSYGLWIDTEDKKFDMVFINKTDPAQQIVYITADIKPDGKMEGSAQLSAYSFGRVNAMKRYKGDGEQKFIDHLRDNDNSLKIAELKMENMEADSLPLNQKLTFKMELTGSDGNYIYFKPTLFSPLHGTNPFLSEERQSDIDFGYRDNFSITGKFSVPAGYKVDVLPKSATIESEDKSMSFRRLVNAQEGEIVTRYMLDLKKSLFFKEQYEVLHDFYKRMHELMNEQVVLKKS